MSANQNRLLPKSHNHFDTQSTLPHTEGNYINILRSTLLSATLEHLSTRWGLQFCRLETSKPHVLPHFCTCRDKNLRAVRLHRWLPTTSSHFQQYSCFCCSQNYCQNWDFSGGFFLSNITFMNFASLDLQWRCFKRRSWFFRKGADAAAYHHQYLDVGHYLFCCSKYQPSKRKSHIPIPLTMFSLRVLWALRPQVQLPYNGNPGSWRRLLHYEGGGAGDDASGPSAKPALHRGPFAAWQRRWQVQLRCSAGQAGLRLCGEYWQ